MNAMDGGTVVKMTKIAIFTLSFLLTSFSLANSTEVILDPIEQDELDLFLEEARGKTGISTNEVLENLDKQYYENRYTDESNINNDIPIIKIGETFPFKAVLKKESLIRNVETGKEFLTTDPIYVFGVEEFPGSSRSYILNSKNEKAFVTRTINLDSIEAVTELYPTQKGNKIYPPKRSTHSTDKEFTFDLGLNIESGTFPTDPFEQYLTGITFSSGTSSRVTLETYPVSFLPIDFGVSLSRLDIELEAEVANGLLKASGFLIGASARYRFKMGESFRLETLLGAERSLSFDTETEGDSSAFGILSWNAGLRTTYLSKWGNFFIGGQFRSYDVILEESSTGQDLSENRKTGTSLSFLAGYTREFAW